MLLNTYNQNESCHSMNNAYHTFKLTFLCWIRRFRLVRKGRKEGLRITSVCPHLLFTTALTLLFLLEILCMLGNDSKYMNHYHTYLAFADVFRRRISLLSQTLENLGIFFS
uniref:Uncharacterized protein n=1 Tax=Canis lupus familiaris TaxID=9615 RepID=A0A8C0PTI8_CANLF